MVKILAVDDNPANLRIIDRAFRRTDYEILKASSGAEALELAKSQPDLILLDIMMPEMDGYEVCEKLKADDATKKIPIIFVTALTEEIDKHRGIDLGAADFVTKPFNSRALAERVEVQLIKAGVKSIPEDS